VAARFLPQSGGTLSEAKRTLIETCIVVVIGSLFALTANAVNSKGLKLTRNYFPSITIAPAPVAMTTQPATQTSSGAVTTVPTVKADEDPIEKDLRAMGVGIVTGEEVQALASDPNFASGLYLIVDARNDDHYKEGHIPGARQLDHYQLERHIGEVLPLAMSAQKVVVYCSGGPTCDDTKNVIIDLITSGVDRSQIFGYTGGMKDWSKHHRLVEKGELGSGVIVESKDE
jgi:rhodanese-related sulfurtransferase